MHKTHIKLSFWIYKLLVMQLKIGNVQLDNNVLFAPIAGFSEVGFRHMCSKYGAGLTYTELVSAKGLCYGNKGTEELLAREDLSLIHI